MRAGSSFKRPGLSSGRPSLSATPCPPRRGRAVSRALPLVLAALTRLTVAPMIVGLALMLLPPAAAPPWPRLLPVPAQGITAPPGRIATAPVLQGRVTWVRDGDTIEVEGVAVRLARLDCAERGTPAGDAATRHLRALLGKARVTCSLTGEQSHDRQVGRCTLPDGRDLNAVMIDAQLCGAWNTAPEPGQARMPVAAPGAKFIPARRAQPVRCGTAAAAGAASGC